VAFIDREKGWRTIARSWILAISHTTGAERSIPCESCHQDILSFNIISI
jgi:hypothetical protein